MLMAIQYTHTAWRAVPYSRGADQNTKRRSQDSKPSLCREAFDRQSRHSFPFVTGNHMHDQKIYLLPAVELRAGSRRTFVPPIKPAEMITPPILTLSFLLPLLILLISKTHAQAPPNDDDDLTAPGTTPQYHCYPKAPLASTPCGEFSNCAKALLSGFPNDVTAGDFHHGMPDNIFRLPRVAFFGDCAISVDIRDAGRRPPRPGQTLGSWVQIHTLVNTLNAACTYYMLNRAGAASAFTGGTMLVGRGNQVVVTVARYNGGGNGGLASNSTEAEE
ncbi:MAG: hypothetical protein Q9169_003597, partial [Polycauliona sp. 2 TL-2023]